MRKQFVLAAAVVLAACGGGSTVDDPSGSRPTGPTGPVVFDRYSTSQPLLDNSGAGAYKVLLMGNSHASGLAPVLARLLTLGQPGKTVELQMSPGFGFLDDLVNDGVSEQVLESEHWTHVILQGQKYSTTQNRTYPTDAAEYWIRGSKEQGATPVLFPEHPRAGNTWEGRTLWDLHRGIADRENTCVAPVGLVWDEVVFRSPSLVLHQPDGNHASTSGNLLTALVFYPIITGQPVESLPDLSVFDVDPEAERIMREAVSSMLYLYRACYYEQQT